MDDRSMKNDFQSQLSAKVDQQVRQVIGELQMQVIILKAMLELQQGQPNRSDQPPAPAQPDQPKPEPPKQSAHVNGGVRINREAAT
jgi:hypothetical protein